MALKQSKTTKIRNNLITSSFNSMTLLKLKSLITWPSLVKHGNLEWNYTSNRSLRRYNCGGSPFPGVCLVWHVWFTATVVGFGWLLHLCAWRGAKPAPQCSQPSISLRQKAKINNSRNTGQDGITIRFWVKKTQQTNKPHMQSIITSKKSNYRKNRFLKEYMLW